MKKLFNCKMISIKSVGILSLFLLSNAYAKEIELPKHSGDKGSYYLIDVQKKGTTFTVLHKRVGVYDTTYSKTEINCLNKQFKSLGESETSFEDMTYYKNSNWTEIVSGSSKSYLVDYVCKNYK